MMLITMNDVANYPSTAPDILSAPLFPHIIRGTFVNRPNRFVIRCAVGSGIVDAYLPNPGRLWELLLPGRTVYLAARKGTGAGKLAQVAVAVECEGRPILLHTHMANIVTARLLSENKIPGLEGALITKAEVQAGHSRFDFLLERKGKPFFLEVKSCTLFGRSIAMFPDAVTVRGRRHIEELAALSRQGMDCGILFLIHWPHVRFFLPDYHTDLDFAQTFRKVQGSLLIKAVALEWQQDLRLSREVREISVAWDVIDREARDRGSYCILIHIPDNAVVTVGKLGDMPINAGYYIYVGSAKRALAKRMARHIRSKKTMHWHIDYLRKYADSCVALPIRSSVSLEHELAEALGKIADGCVPAFGSSDCTCVSHLFHFSDNPLHFQPFIELLQYFRIDRLEDVYAHSLRVRNS
jgi:sugar fermentation stimulation protein A